MISGARETVAEIEAPLPRKRALCRIHHVLLKRLILKFGDGGDGFTPDNVRGGFGRRGIKIYRGTSGTKRKLYPKREEVKNHGSDLCPYLESQSSWND